MPSASTRTAPPVVVIFGDEQFQKARTLKQLLDALLPPHIERSLALAVYDGTRSEEQGGPSLAAVLDDLATLPFLSDRRVVVIQDADGFISAHREALERYLAAPSPVGTLVLLCRSFPRNTRLYAAAGACGGQLFECKKLTTPALIDFVVSEAGARGKQIDHSLAARLVDMVGQDQGLLAAEVEKLCLYAADRRHIGDDDVSALVGLSREEQVFAAMDAAAAGRLQNAIELWQRVVSTDPAATFRAVGGVAFKLRQWIAAHRLAAEGLAAHAIAPRVMMWRRERELETLLRRLPARRLRRFLAGLADLDSQAKLGLRSIETGIETLLIELATAGSCPAM